MEGKVDNKTAIRRLPRSNQGTVRLQSFATLRLYRLTVAYGLIAAHLRARAGRFLFVRADCPFPQNDFNGLQVSLDKAFLSTIHSIGESHYNTHVPPDGYRVLRTCKLRMALIAKSTHWPKSQEA
jgi:hypothetical protein